MSLSSARSASGTASRVRAGRMDSHQFGDRLLLGLVILLAILWTVPLVWVLGLSFKPNDVLMHSTGGILSAPFTLKNYADILASSNVFTWILNSIIVSGGQTVLTLVVCSLAGYGFARTEFPFKGVIFALVLAGLAVPEQAIVIPLFKMFADINLHNTYAALILPRLAVPFGVFLMTQYFRAVPREIEEAALLDNASRLKIFLVVVLPLSIPAQATLGIYTFLASWNDYLWPLISASKPEMFTLTVGLASTQMNFAQSEGIGFLMAQAIFAGLPILILYLFFQRHIVTAVAGTTVR
ncbi:carbohydrate ABC transporter permease [Radicibacter daui]|uniref:carbohydrate ABC transporter permease n=1 Tax=Radicibacter daui TaxID=3064829 RepID=UPI004046950C